MGFQNKTPPIYMQPPPYLESTNGKKPPSGLKNSHLAGGGFGGLVLGNPGRLCYEMLTTPNEKTIKKKYILVLPQRQFDAKKKTIVDIVNCLLYCCCILDKIIIIERNH